VGDGHDFLATTVVARRDGRRLLTSAGDNTTRLWDLATGSQSAVLSGTGRHAGLAVSADGRHVLTGAVPVESPDPSGSSVQRTYALLWDLETQQIVRRYGETIEQRLATAAPLSAVTAAAISADGSLVFTGHSDGQGRLWRGEAEQPVPFQGHTRSVTAAVFVPSHPNRLLTASGDRTVAQWDVDTGREQLDRAMDHDGWVTSLSVSDDGRTALTASEDGFVRLWDIDTAQELARVDASGEIVHGLGFAASRNSLLWVGDDGVVRISDVDGDEDERTIDVVSGDWVYSLAVSPAGDRLAIIDGDGGVSLVDAATGKQLRRVDNLHSRDAAFLPAGDRLVCGSPDGTLSLIDVAGSAAVRQWHAHDGGVRQVAVSPGGSWVASAGADGVVRLWDLQGDTARELHALTGHAGGATAIAVGADGSMLAAGAADGTLRLWTPDGDAIGTFTAHPGGVRAVAISPAGDHIVTGGADRMIRIWQRGSSSPVAELEAHDGVLRSLAFSPDGRTLASLAADRAVRLWQTDTWKWSGEIAKGRGMNAHPVAAASPDGRTIAIGNSGERRFRLYRFDRDRSSALEPEREFRTESGVVWSAALSPDAGSLVTIGGDAARVWNVASQSIVLTMRPQGVVSAVGYSPDGTRVVTGSWDHAARIWDTVSGRVVRQLTGGHLGNVTQSAYLPDGVRVITAGDDGAIRIWNANSGELEAPSLQESGAAVMGLALSQNGRLVATVSADNVLRIWDLPGRKLVDAWDAADIGVGVGPLLCCAIEPQGRQIAVGTSLNALLLVPGVAEPQHRLTGHTAAVLAVAFSPDGKRLITGSEDFTARIWDVESGKEMLSLGRHTGAVTSVSFSGDGQAVLTAGRDGLAIVWPADVIAPSVLTTRDRFDYRQVGSVAVIDEGLELNAPTHTSPAGLTVRAELQSATEAQVRLGKLCLAAGENSAVTVAGNDVAVLGDDGSAVSAARLEVSDDGRRLDVAFAPGADRARANDILRRIAFRIDPDPSRAVPPGEPQFESVTFRVVDSGTAVSTGPPASQNVELPAIEIQILLTADGGAAAARENAHTFATLPTSAKD
jgi:WD40 repeat protein